MKFIKNLIVGLFIGYCILQNLVNVIGALQGFGISMDGSLRFWLVMLGGVVTSTIAITLLLDKLANKNK